MNYKKIYDQLIEKRRQNQINRTETQYCEYHHIVPLCMHGEDTPRNKKFNYNGTNIIGLTAREHYIAHVLLAKIYKNTKYEYGLLLAVTKMRCIARKKYGIN